MGFGLIYIKMIPLAADLCQFFGDDKKNMKE